MSADTPSRDSGLAKPKAVIGVRKSPGDSPFWSWWVKWPAGGSVGSAANTEARALHLALECANAHGYFDDEVIREV